MTIEEQNVRPGAVEPHGDSSGWPQQLADLLVDDHQRRTARVEDLEREVARMRATISRLRDDVVILRAESFAMKTELAWSWVAQNPGEPVRFHRDRSLRWDSMEIMLGLLTVVVERKYGWISSTIQPSGE